MTRPLTDEEIEMLLNPPMEEILPRERKLTSVSDAIEAYKNSVFEKGYESGNEKLCYTKLGIYLGEKDNYYSFLGYPHSSKKPVDYEYAFGIYIHKELDEISTSSAPISGKLKKTWC
jgi:hypothetical protein